MVSNTNSKNKNRIDWTTLTILLLCIAVNGAGLIGASLLGLPVMLDFTGSFIAAVAGGPFATLIVSIITGILVVLTGAVSPLYLIIEILCAMAVAFLIRNKNVIHAGEIFMALGLVAAVAHAVLVFIFKQPVLLNAAESFRSEAALWLVSETEISASLAAILVDVLVEILDKGLCVLLGYLVAYGLFRMGRGAKKRGFRTAIVISVILIILSGGVFGTVSCVEAIDVVPVNYNVERIPVETEIPEVELDDSHCDAKNYKPTMYGNTGVYQSMEATCLAATADGYIWLGGASGLYRFDGNNYKKYEETGITEVTTLFVDNSGRLWIGTKDKGLALFTSDMVAYMSTTENLLDNPVLGIAQGSDGTIYAQLASGLFRVTSGGSLELKNADITELGSLCIVDNYYLGVKEGKVVAFNQDSQVAEVSPREKDVEFTCLAASEDRILAGCSNGDLILLSFENEELEREEKFTNGHKESIKKIDILSSGVTTFVSEDYFGLLSTSGSYTTRKIENFSGLTDISGDYQGNLWVVSATNGICELAENEFVNLFAAADLPEDKVCNAILLEQGRYYIGTDNGLVIIDKATNTQVTNAITKKLSGMKVTDIYRDTFNNLWFATHGGGLIEFETDNDFHQFSSNSGAGTSSVNCVLETFDKSLVMGTDNGTVVFFNNNKVMGIDYAVGAVMGANSGLKASSILCIERDQTGKLYVGTDDNGLYVVKNKKVLEHYTTEDGLQSNKVSSIVTHGSGFYLVTGNGLCRINEGTVTPITTLDYYNVYDLIIYKENGYITGPFGIAKVPIAELDSDSVKTVEVFSTEQGLTEKLNPEAKNIVDGSKLLFGADTGVVSFSAVNSEESEGFTYYKIGLESVTADGQEIHQSEDGVYYIPSQIEKIIFTPSVIDYSGADVKFKFFVEGIKGQNAIFTQKDALSVPHLEYGRHRLWLQVLSEDEQSVIQEAAFILDKDSLDYEKEWYVFKLIPVVIWDVLYVICTAIIFIVIRRAKHISTLMQSDVDDL